MPAQDPATLIAAFSKAHYAIFAPKASFTIHIGQYSAPLASLMAHCNSPTLAILTAYNPQGKPAHANINADAQRLLLDSVHKLGLHYLIGKNSAPDGRSHAEPTLAVFGMSRAQAYALAQQFRQLAFVYADARAIPELVLV